jgi:tetratricopeptide (TPR) repeat protein
LGHVALNDYLTRIERLLADNRLNEAVAHCRHILAQYPRHTATYRLYARALFEQQDYSGAIDLFQRVLSAEPADLIAHAGLAHAYQESGDLERAIWHLERAFEQEPYNRAIRQELQRMVAAGGDGQTSLHSLGSPALARIHFRGGRYGLAAEEAEAVLNQDPDRLDLQVLRAEALFHDGRPAEALRLSMAVIEKLPDCVAANAILAAVWRNTGQDSAAEKHLRRLWSCTLLDAEGRDPGSVVGQAFLSDGRYSLPDRLYVEELDYTPAAGLLDFAGADWVQELQAAGFLQESPPVRQFEAETEVEDRQERAPAAQVAPWKADEEVLAWLERDPGFGSIGAGDLAIDEESTQVGPTETGDAADFETRLFGTDQDKGPAAELPWPVAHMESDLGATPDLFDRRAPESEVPGDDTTEDLVRGPEEAGGLPDDDIQSAQAPGEDLLVWLEDVLGQGRSAAAAEAPETTETIETPVEAEVDLFREPERPAADSGAEPWTEERRPSEEAEADRFLASLVDIEQTVEDVPTTEEAAAGGETAIGQDEAIGSTSFDKPEEAELPAPAVHGTMIGLYEEALTVEGDTSPEDLAALLGELASEESEAETASAPASEGMLPPEYAVTDDENDAGESTQALAALLDELSQAGQEPDASAEAAIGAEAGVADVDISTWWDELIVSAQGAQSDPQGISAGAEGRADASLVEVSPEPSTEGEMDQPDEAAAPGEPATASEDDSSPPAPAGEFDWLGEMAAHVVGSTELVAPDTPDESEAAFEDQSSEWFAEVLEEKSAELENGSEGLAPAGKEAETDDDIPEWLQELADKARRGSDEPE